MQDPYHNLISCLLPEGILAYFDLTNVLQGPAGLQLQLEEKNILPEAYHGQRSESKGFLPEIKLQDFPIRGQKVTLCIKRRRWHLPDSGEVITRDWKLVQQGTRMTREFAAFLKAALG
ncbi:ISAon1 family transposase N-terminal region protein [Pontibacter sp. CAU 1760]